jgi:hypothetical protein
MEFGGSPENIPVPPSAEEPSPNASNLTAETARSILELYGICPLNKSRVARRFECAARNGLGAVVVVRFSLQNIPC